MSNKTLSVNSLNIQVNLPDAPEGEGVHGLPPYKRIDSYLVDEYNCPSNWMNGSAKASSYFLPVKAGKHLWIDLNELSNHKHDIAVVISVQGINPITGQHTKSLQLEQYQTNCPVHNKPFKQDRLCETCGYKWPSQNYMTTTSWPRGRLWIDGFRTESGTIRGFLFTEETMRGVATQLIGEDRVYAIGVAFYLSKEVKKQPEPFSVNHFNMYDNSDVMHSFSPSFKPMVQNKVMRRSMVNLSGIRGQNMLGGTSSASYNCESPQQSNCDEVSRGLDPQYYSESDYDYSDEVKCETKLEIGAGAKISQETCYTDPNSVDYYQSEPAGLIYINYATEEDVEKILKRGKKDTTAGGEGFLKPLKVGN